jgi:hypothetical protein
MTEYVNVYSAGDNITICSECEDIAPGYSPVVIFPLNCGCDAQFTFHQINPDTTWNVCHNLGKYPSVVVTDDSGNLLNPNIQHLDTNVLLITFGAAQEGFAYMN